MDAPSLLAPLALSFGANLFEALRDTDIVGLLCILCLLIMSFFTGYYIIVKFFEIRNAQRQSNSFIEECLEGRKSLPEIYRAAKDYPDSPMATLLREAYIEYEMEMREDFISSLPVEQKVQLGKHSVESALERTIAAESRRLENHLINLATTSTIAPFIGLFGTVWGVLGAFQALGRDGSAALGTLAPGIATALTTTVFGLIVAIPAAAFYNYLSGNVTKLGSQMDSFAHELTNVFQKHLLRRG